MKEPTMNDYVDRLEKMLEKRAGKEFASCPCKPRFMVDIGIDHILLFNEPSEDHPFSRSGCALCQEFMETTDCPCEDDQYGKDAPDEAWKRIREYREKQKNV